MLFVRAILSQCFYFVSASLPSQALRASSPRGGAFGSNGDDRRQRRKQGGAVGAAASRMRAAAKQTLGAATRAVARRRRDGEGKPGTKEHLHSDKHWLLIESSYRCVFVLSQHPCPLRRSAPALPEGEPWAKESVISITKKAPGTMRNVPGAFRTKRRDAETLRPGGWLFSGSVRCGLRRPR